jgi:low affinity Fe/Cu permease
VNASTSPGPGIKQPSRYARLARWAADFAGSPAAGFVLLGMFVAWLVVGVMSDWARWWELVVTVGFPFLTLGLLMLLQHTQTHGNLALHLKLDEIICAQQGASDELLRAEEASDEDLERYRERKLNSTFAERRP